MCWLCDYSASYLRLYCDHYGRAVLCYICVWYFEIQGEVGARGEPGEMGFQGDKVRLLLHKQDFMQIAWTCAYINP